MPLLASRGATPAWRASWASVRKRSIGPISQSSFAALNGPQPDSWSSRGAMLLVRAWSSRSRSEIERVRLRQRPSSSRAIRTCVVLVCPGELPIDPVEPDRPVERAERHLQRRVELVQMPAQPLLAAPPLVDEVVAVVEQ